MGKTPAQRNEETPSASELMRDMSNHLAAQSAEVVPVDKATVVLPQSYGLNFVDLVNSPNADEVEGFDLLTSEHKHRLIGVPFVIIGATVREGITQDGRRSNYWSLEIVTADEPTLKERVSRGRVTDPTGKPLEAALVGPNETLVINDGSTGIGRQITEYLHRKGLISVGVISDDTATGGAAGESPYDRYHEEWPYGADKATAGLNYRNAGLTLVCPRGLRVSEYDNPRDPTGKTKSYTYYLA